MDSFGYPCIPPPPPPPHTAASTGVETSVQARRMGESQQKQGCHVGIRFWGPQPGISIWMALGLRGGHSWPLEQKAQNGHSMFPNHRIKASGLFFFNTPWECSVICRPAHAPLVWNAHQTKTKTKAWKPQKSGGL